MFCFAQSNPSHRIESIGRATEGSGSAAPSDEVRQFIAAFHFPGFPAFDEAIRPGRKPEKPLRGEAKLRAFTAGVAAFPGFARQAALQNAGSASCCTSKCHDQYLSTD